MCPRVIDDCGWALDGGPTFPGLRWRRRPLKPKAMSLHPRARIHTDNIVANWRAISALTPGSEAGAVVKANAYGHGVGAVARALHQAGCRTFYVAYAEEGAELRDAIGLAAEIFVFNGAEAGDRALVQAKQLVPVINSIPALKAWLSHEDVGDYAVHIDTGMNRLGIRPEDVPDLIDLTAARPPVQIMSHLIDSDIPVHPLNAHQQAEFSRLSAAWPEIRKSLANTGGCFLGEAYGFDVTRPGIGLYGGGPVPPEGVTLRPGMTLEAPILTVQQVQPGESVGYGGEWSFASARTLATVALGYGDGFPRSATNTGYATLNGHRCRIVGRVSMDLITIDVTTASALAKPGAFAHFIGAEVPLEDQAKRAGTVGYELVTGLGNRVRRIYE